MARLFDSLRNTRWVIWSSPLLLLVLVFSLRAHPATGARTLTPSTTSPPTTSTQVATIPSVPTTVVSALRHIVTTPPSNKPRASTVAPFSPLTDSSGASFAKAPDLNASAGVLEGTLRRGEPPIVLPLWGPGTWTLSSNAALDAQLVCGARSVRVATLIEVAARASCQLVLAANQVTSWQLTPLS